jgi:hypothetical protein
MSLHCTAGEEPHVGQAQDNYLAFEARLDTKADSGAMVLYWPNGGAGCSSNISWPILDTVTVLGVPPVDPESITVLVRMLEGYAASQQASA